MAWLWRRVRCLCTTWCCHCICQEYVGSSNLSIIELLVQCRNHDINCGHQEWFQRQTGTKDQGNEEVLIALCWKSNLRSKKNFTIILESHLTSSGSYIAISIFFPPDRDSTWEDCKLRRTNGCSCRRKGKCWCWRTELMMNAWGLSSYRSGGCLFVIDLSLSILVNVEPV